MTGLFGVVFVFKTGLSAGGIVEDFVACRYSNTRTRLPVCLMDVAMREGFPNAGVEPVLYIFPTMRFWSLFRPVDIQLGYKASSPPYEGKQVVSPPHSVSGSIDAGFMGCFSSYGVPIPVWLPEACRRQRFNVGCIRGWRTPAPGSLER
jgi:hypothetical protein